MTRRLPKSSPRPTDAAVLPPRGALADLLAPQLSAELSAALAAFRAFILLHGATRSWNWFSLLGGLDAGMTVALALVALLLTGCAAAAWTRHARLACVAALPIYAFEQYQLFPNAEAHTLLAFAVVVMFALLDPDDEREGRWLAGGLRWIAIVTMSSLGLQKLLFGFYLQGEVPSLALAGRDAWGSIFEPFVPAGELTRLITEGVVRPGAGPFRSESVVLMIVANLVWVAEIALPLAVLARRWRSAAAIAAIALVALLYIPSGNALYALVLIQLLLVVPNPAWNERATWPLVAVYAYIFGVYVLEFPGSALLSRPVS